MNRIALRAALLLAALPAAAQEDGPPGPDDPSRSHRPIESLPGGGIDLSSWTLPSQADRESLERMQRMLDGLRDLGRSQAEQGFPHDPARLQAELDRLDIDPELRRIAMEYALRQQEDMAGGGEEEEGPTTLEARLQEKLYEWLGRDRAELPPFDPGAPGEPEEALGETAPVEGSADPAAGSEKLAPGSSEESGSWDVWLSRRVEGEFEELLRDAKGRLEEDDALSDLPGGSGVLDLFEGWKRDYHSSLERILDPPAGGAPAGTASGRGSDALALALIAIGLAGLAATALLARRFRSIRESAKRRLVVRLPARIEGREDLVRAHDSAAVLVLGESALPLSHLEAAAAMAAARPGRAEALGRLSALYAMCRYAPTGWTPPAEELAEAAALLFRIVSPDPGE